jgi:streptogramin lyase
MFYTSYYVSTGCELVGCDFRDGRMFRKKLPSNGGYGIAVGLDGSVYIGGVNPGDLYRFDPKTDALTTIDIKQFGVDYIWDLAVGPDGVVYCAAGYPKTRLVTFAPASGEVRDLGELAPSEQYHRCICVDRFGKVWCGVGSRAHLIVYDPADDSRREVLPQAYSASSTVYRLESCGRYVVAHVSFDGVLLVFDTETQEVVRAVPKLEDDEAWSIARSGGGDILYITSRPSLRTFRYNVETGERTPLSVPPGQIKAVEQGRWVHAVDDQDYVVHDLQEEREVIRTRLTQGGDGMAVYALTSGPDGNVYGGTYINMHLFRCDATSGALQDLGKFSRWSGQVDSMSLGRDGLIYLGAYVHAVISVFDPAAPWRPGREPDSNPREIGPLGKGQFRTQANTLGPDGRLYVGSVPSYNSATTGAFSICDPKIGTKDVRLDFVPGGAVNALVSDTQDVYGAGGGEFFVYDPATGKKRFYLTRPVTAMALLRDGYVSVSGGGTLFVYDRESNVISADADNPAGDFSHMCSGADGAVYGVNDGHVVRVGPDGVSVEVLADEGGKYLATDSKGRVYFARGPRVFRCTPPQSPGKS